MELPVNPDRGSWRGQMLLLAVIVGAIILLQLAGMIATSKDTSAETGVFESDLSGDIYVKQILAGLGMGAGTKLAGYAEKFYRRGLPSRDSARRIIVLQGSLMEQIPPRILDDLESKAARTLTSSEIAKWNEIYGPKKITPKRSDELAKWVNNLNLGPGRFYALSQVYKQSGQSTRAARILRDGKNSAVRSLAAVGAIMLGLFLCGVAGIAIAVYFFTNNRWKMDSNPKPRISPGTMLMGFFAYLIGYVVFGVAMASLGESIRVRPFSNDSDAYTLLWQIVAGLLTLGFGLGVMKRLAAKNGDDIREAGLRWMRPGKAALWGLGGYCTAIPFWIVAIILSTTFFNIFFRQVESPSHPLVSYVALGGWPLVLVFLMASVVAPIVEETFFRGALYTALRSNYGVWESALFSGGIFALVHPIPGHYLPIAVLGTVLAIIRERTGSVFPCIICHSIYNSVLMGLVVLMLF